MTSKLFFLGGLGLASALLASGCARPLADDPAPNLEAATAIRVSLVGASDATGEEGAAAEVVGTGWGTLKGVFKLADNASPRQPQALTVNKDEAVCAPMGHQVLDEVFLFDPQDRGIRNVVIYARDARRVHESALPNNEEVVFDQKDCVFLDHVFAMRLGQTMLIKNSDPIGHNTNISAAKGTGFNQTIPANQSVTFTPNAEEVMPVKVNCSIHPWMLSYLLPRGNGYFAVTKPDGTFEIPNLPAGEEIEFQVWHELATGAGGAVAEGEATGVSWNKRGRFKLKLNENEERSLEIVLPGSAFKS